jgi:hypothetical protein
MEVSVHKPQVDARCGLAVVRLLDFKSCAWAAPDPAGVCVFCWIWLCRAAWARLGQYCEGISNCIYLSLFLSQRVQPLSVNIQTMIADGVLVRSRVTPILNKLLIQTHRSIAVGWYMENHYGLLYSLPCFGFKGQPALLWGRTDKRASGQAPGRVQAV